MTSDKVVPKLYKHIAVRSHVITQCTMPARRTKTSSRSGQDQLERKRVNFEHSNQQPILSS